MGCSADQRKNQCYYNSTDEDGHTSQSSRTEIYEYILNPDTIHHADINYSAIGPQY
jgi:hypothetical protein